VYFAPRGRERLLRMGDQIGQMYLSYDDKLIGIVGDSGSGKSLILKGMFPGVDLANDDDGLDIHKVMQVRGMMESNYRNATYHIDMRFELAFMQMYEIVDFVKGALDKGRRVIIEHFDLLYPHLKINADLLLGVGEEIIVTRPNLFGPMPQDLYNIVIPSLKYRRMAHTAEDMTMTVLQDSYGVGLDTVVHGDVRGGFIVNFREKPDIDIEELETKIKAWMERSVDVTYLDDNNIKIGGMKIRCGGPRIHVRNTSEIVNFQLIKDFKYDSSIKMYSLIGLIGERNNVDIEKNDLNKISVGEIEGNRRDR
jgi:ABC-type oligopeptide transport system ATPase subunit